MSIVKLTPEQIEKLMTSCQKLGVGFDFVPNEKFGEALLRLQNICDCLSYGVDELSDTVSDLDMAGYDRNFDEVVNGFEKMTNNLEEMLADIDDITKAAQNALAAFRDLTQCTEYELILSDEEINEIIEQNFKPDTTMSVGYRDGQFALLFCEVVDEVEKEEAFLVKVFATGDAAAYDAVEAYINKFMDCELE